MESKMTPENSQALLEFTQSTIYLMGASFVLGSLFTLFLLLVLDFVRRNKTGNEQ
jgi:ABC-type methionine transport system permease subunit